MLLGPVQPAAGRAHRMFSSAPPCLAPPTQAQLEESHKGEEAQLAQEAERAKQAEQLQRALGEARARAEGAEAELRAREQQAEVREQELGQLRERLLNEEEQVGRWWSCEQFCGRYCG